MAKMKNGVIKRGSGYSYMVREPDPATCKTKQVWVSGFTTHAAAKAARAEHIVRVKNGISVTRDNQTFTEYLHDWLAGLDLQPKTVDGYRYHIEHYVAARFGGLRLQDLRPNDLTRFYADLRRDGGRDSGVLGLPSVKAVHATLRVALSAAVDAQMLVVNPALRAKLPPGPRPSTREEVEEEEEETKMFSPEELHRLLSTSRPSRLFPLLHLAAYTGCRRGELMYLRWQDLNLSTQQLKVGGSRGLVGGRVLEGRTKGGRARTISLDSKTIKVLAEHRDAQQQERSAAGVLWREGADSIFRTVRGYPLAPDAPTKAMPNLCDRAGVPRHTFHALRHTHASILLSHGVPVHEVSQRLGHADPQTTLRIYAHVLEARANLLGQTFAATFDNALAVPSKAH